MVSSDIALSLSHATTFERLGSWPKRVHVCCSGPTCELWLISAVRHVRHTGAHHEALRDRDWAQL
jgi:hypothetical protein